MGGRTTKSSLSTGAKTGETSKPVESNLHKGNMGNEDVTGIMRVGMINHDRSDIKSVLEDIRVGDTIEVYTKTRKGNEYRLSVSPNEDGTYKLITNYKGNKTTLAKTTINNAVDEFEYWSGTTQDINPRPTIKRKQIR